MKDDASANLDESLTDAMAAGLFDLGYRAVPAEIFEMPAAVVGDLPGASIGRYRLIAPLGEGGFGVVWRAEQTEPIRRELALKLIKRGMDSGEIIARFQAESQALAIMDHPNIAAVLDAGTTPDWRPYFAMELVKGEPLTGYCDARSLSIRERLELFIPVCQAVQHAHQKAILHRDLKPSNILVAETDGRAIPKVIDFGIAKALGTADEPTLLRTRAGLVIGTPNYMSPEQAGSVPDVDTRSDIYSLGVILYELLTGQTPLGRAGGGNGAAQDETLRRIRTEEAIKPSNGFHPLTATSLTAATARNSDPQKLRRLLCRDLDWIVLKALEKDRRRRYETATALAADLQRYLRREPVSAAAPTWTYQFSRFARRNRVGFVTAGIVSAALVAGTAISLWQAREARKASAEARANYLDARQAVEHYLSRVTDNPRLKDANFQTLRKELLETAMPFYEKQGRKAGNDLGLLADRAWATGSLAQIHQELGDLPQAEALFREAIRQNQRILAAAPGNRDAREYLTVHYNNLTRTLQTQGRTEEALVIQRQAETIAAGLVAQFPDEPELRFGLMTILLNQVFQLDGTGHKQEAEKVCQRVFELGRELVLEHPANPDYRGQLASALSTQAGFHHDAGRLEESETTFREAMAVQEKLFAEFPKARFQANPLAITCHNLGYLLSRRGRLEEAEVLLRRSVEVQRGIVTDYPEMPRPRRDLGNALNVLGAVLGSQGKDEEAAGALEESANLLMALRQAQPENPEAWHAEGISLDQIAALKRKGQRWSEAREALSQAIVCQRRALQLSPGRANYQAALESNLRGLAETCIDAGDAPAAAATLEEFANEPLTRVEEHENLAVLFTRILGLVASTSGLSSEERTNLTTRCGDLAVAGLLKACTLGYTALAAAKHDDRFAPLRSHPPFMAMREPDADPVDRSPSRFTFNYPHDDPGKRVWTRNGDRWTEVQPSGKTNIYQIDRRARLGGNSGSEALQTDGTGLRIFIPDKKGSAMGLMISVEPDKWIFVGIIGDVE